MDGFMSLLVFHKKMINIYSELCVKHLDFPFTSIFAFIPQFQHQLVTKKEENIPISKACLLWIVKLQVKNHEIIQADCTKQRLPDWYQKQSSLRFQQVASNNGIIYCHNWIMVRIPHKWFILCPGLKEPIQTNTEN